MDASSIIGTIIVILTGFTTYMGFSRTKYFEDSEFHVDKILINKEYRRLVSSGFLHVSWLHFGFNMIALASFSLSLEQILGLQKFILIYFCSLVGGNLLALYIHRNHGNYRAVGASGAISGVVLSSIILFPEGEISLILLPYGIKSWIFGLVFILLSIFGIKSGKDNIGHEAHLGGALVGVLVTLLLQPSILQTNWWIVALIVIPVAAFLLLIIKNPAVLMIDNYWGETLSAARSRKKRVPETADKEVNLNSLLEKIKKEGIESLSRSEKKQLDKLKDEI